MKKVISIVTSAVLALATVLSLSACGSSNKIQIAIPNDTTNEARALLLLQNGAL